MTVSERADLRYELMHLRTVAQTWVTDLLNQAEAAAYKLDWEMSNHHCCQAIEAAQTAADEIEDFIGQNMAVLKQVPGLTVEDLSSGNKKFVSRVHQAASLVALFALELRVTSKVMPQA